MQQSLGGNFAPRSARQRHIDALIDRARYHRARHPLVAALDFYLARILDRDEAVAIYRAHDVSERQFSRDVRARRKAMKQRG